MTALTLQGLIAKLEKATGPDRELDIRIWWLMMPPDHRQLFDPTGYIGGVIEREWQKGRLEGLFYSSSDNPPDKFDHAPRYTGSVTSALELMPEGYDWLIGRGRTRPSEPLYGVQIFPPSSGRMMECPVPVAIAESETIMIAITLCALRACATIPEQTGAA